MCLPYEPLPKGVLSLSSAVASSRTSGTPTRTPADRVSQALSAGGYACRPLSLRLSATSPTIPQTTRYQTLHPIPVPESHHPGPPRILLTPISGLAPAGAAPANTPPRQLMPSAAWPHARLSLGAAAWRASRAWLTLQAGSGTPGALEEEEAHQVPLVLTVGIAHRTLRSVSPTRPSPSSTRRRTARNPCSAPGNVGPAFPFCLDGPPRPPPPTTCRLLDPRPRPRAAAPPPSGPGEPDAACMGEVCRGGLSAHASRMREDPRFS